MKILAGICLVLKLLENNVNAVAVKKGHVCTAEEVKAVIQCHTDFMESSNITVPKWKLPDFYAVAAKRNISAFLAIDAVKCEKEDGCCDNGCCPRNQFRRADRLITCLSSPLISRECRAAVYDEGYDHRRFVARLNAAIFKTLEFSCDRSKFMLDVYNCLANLSMIGDFHRAAKASKVVPDHERKAKSVCDHFALSALETAERRTRRYSCRLAGLYLCSGFDIIAEVFAGDQCVAEVMKSKSIP